MNLLRFSAHNPSPPPVMGSAVDRPDLKQLPIQLNACLWDSFREGPDLTKDIIAHGDLVNAACAKEMIRLGWNPKSLNINSLEAFKDVETDPSFIAKQGKELLRLAKTLPHFIGTFCSSGISALSDNAIDFRPIIKEWEIGNNLFFNAYKKVIKLLSPWPHFVSNENNKLAISYKAVQLESIAVASTKQRRQKNHRDVVNLFVNGEFSAVITKDGLDFDGDGVTDYQCKIHNAMAVGYRFTDNYNSFATPIAFARYACRLMEELAKTPEKTAQRLKQINLYDFAFPDLATYQKHPSYTGAVKVVA